MDQTATASRLTAFRKRKKRGSRYRSTSDIMHDMVGFHDEAITTRDLSSQLGDRGFGLMLLLFALPNAIPLPVPGISTLTSLPLLFFSAQLCLGKERIWLPNRVANWHIPMSRLRPWIQKCLPWLKRLEKLIKPRYDRLTTRNFERFAGGLIFLLALLMALPVPFGNLPLGIAMAVLALAVTERDGLMMIMGWLLTVLALCFFGALISGYAWIVWQLIGQIA